MKLLAAVLAFGAIAAQSSSASATAGGCDHPTSWDQYHIEIFIQHVYWQPKMDQENHYEISGGKAVLIHTKYAYCGH